MMTEKLHYQTAKASAGEAIEALWTVYRAESFDADLLEDCLAGLICSFIQNAQRLDEPAAYSRTLESEPVCGSNSQKFTDPDPQIHNHS